MPTSTSSSLNTSTVKEPTLEQQSDSNSKPQYLFQRTSETKTAPTELSTYVPETAPESQTVIEQMPAEESEFDQGIPWLEDVKEKGALAEPNPRTPPSEVITLQGEEEKPAGLVEWIQKKWEDFLRFWRR